MIQIQKMFPYHSPFSVFHYPLFFFQGDSRDPVVCVLPCVWRPGGFESAGIYFKETF